MKKLYFILLLFVWAACGSDSGAPSLTPEQEATQRLANTNSATWEVSLVTRNSQQETQFYQDMTVTFTTEKGFSSSNANDLFPASTTFSFPDEENLGRILLAGNRPASGVPITFTRNANTLRLEFTVSAAGAEQETSPVSRIQAIGGSYVLQFTLRQ
ncbi:hypothetical protein A3SI_12484 [Nitritalea halalkaliphila LW7]|uniref:Lipocalin-like domain-containing protein n=1 Tax=Nitritalea halalkaliphila LW7 TaxID=1189621 RepID=I5C1G6_9BACT|nr:hypothetical protein [Nitritalea halalkaliphila]EIM75668.1 hypothetical protein A3SI_12484 [Nitritalea halalkaliphila LW7]